MNRILLLAGCILFAVGPVQAQQEIPTDTYAAAKELAFSGDYPAAIEILVDLRNRHPENTAYTLFLSRVYSWNKEFKKAIGLLEPLALNKEPSMEALELLVTICLWDQQYEKALSVIEQRLPEHAGSFRIERARALHGLDRNEEALEELQHLLDDPQHKEEALALQTLIFKENKKAISLSYRNTSFASPGSVSWHHFAVGYKQEIRNLPVVLRYHYGRMHLRDGNQLELDVYPKISERSYLYLNAGVSLDQGLFPTVRGGIEYYFSLENDLSMSLGTKYLEFENSRVHLFTGMLSYPLGEHLSLSYRPFVSYLPDQWGWTHTLAIKSSQPLKESFFQVDLQYGSVPHEYFVTESFTELRSLRAGLQYHFRLSEHILLQPIFLYEYEEYTPGSYRNRFNSQLLSIFRF